MSKPGYTAVLVAGHSIEVTIDGKTYPVAYDSPNFNRLCDAIRDRAAKDEVLALASPLETYKVVAGEAGFEIKLDPKTGAPLLFVDGEQVHSKLALMILAHFRAGEELTHLKNFMLKAKQSKSLGEIDVLYEFVDHNKLPIHPDGDFFAFKAARRDGYDKHSGTVLYKIGAYNEAKSFDPNAYTQCSSGLHIGGRAYVSWFGSSDGKTFVVKVNPADAIFYRTSGEAGKMRVRKLFCYAEISRGESLEGVLAFNAIMSPQGDLLQAAADRKIMRAAGADRSSDPAEYLPRVEGEPAVAQDEIDDDEAPVEDSPQVRAAKEKLREKRKARKKATKAERKARVAVARAKRSQTFVSAKTSRKKIVVHTFTTAANVSYTAQQIIDGLKAHGQRGFAKLTNIPRTTLQEWKLLIDGKPARVR